MRRADKLVLVAISIAGVVVAALDFAGVISKIPYAQVTLVLLGAVGLQLVILSITADDAAKRQVTLTEKLLGRVESTDITRFASGKEIEEYLAKRIRDAKVEVCDLSWKLEISASFGSMSRTKSHSAYEASIKAASKLLTYREIFIFNDPRRLEKMLRRIAEARPGYSCRYYENNSGIPRLQFVIIDNEEVVIFAMSAHSTLCVVRNPTLLGVFKPYFEEAWRKAIPLKDGPMVHQVNVEQAIRSISSNT
jgi:hypothetical protein